MPGERPLLIVAAMRTAVRDGSIELNVKKAEAQSMLRRMGCKTEPERPAASKAASGGGAATATRRLLATIVAN